MIKKVFPISIAVLWGTVFTTAMHSLALGICMGLMMGIVFGMFDSDKKNDQEKEKKEVRPQ